MTEAQLEAAIWKSFADFRITVPDAVPFVEHLMRVARAYATGDTELVAAGRRHVLFRDGVETGKEADQ